jgi:hypothetical protein
LGTGDHHSKLEAAGGLTSALFCRINDLIGYPLRHIFHVFAPAIFLTITQFLPYLAHFWVGGVGSRVLGDPNMRHPPFCGTSRISKKMEKNQPMRAKSLRKLQMG